MMGNDDNEYVVKADKNGTHRWVKVKSAEKPKKPKKSKKSPRKPKAAERRAWLEERSREELRRIKEEALGELGDDDETVFVYPIPIVGFEQSWAEDCGATYIGGSGGDDAQYAVPRGTYANAKKLWKKMLKEQGLKVSWPISKSYATLEKQKKKLGLGEGNLEDVEELALMASGKKKSPKKSPKKKPAKKSKKKPAKKSKKKKKTIAQIRAECKKKGLVYDRETKRCRKSKRGKKSGKKPPKKSGKKSKKMYAKGSKDKCGKMPARLKRIKTPKVCVKVLTGPNKGKHKYVTLSAARAGGYKPKTIGDYLGN